MPFREKDIDGLTDAEVISSREMHGYNRLSYKKQYGFLIEAGKLAREPMIILLLVASSVYFLNGNISDGLFLAGAIILVASISLFQDTRSRNALSAITKLSTPKCKVIRNGIRQEISTEELVVDDILIAEEGSVIEADAEIIQSNDFSVNESMLTGESLPVYKDQHQGDHFIFKGTVVTGGLAIGRITAIGNKTRLGAIGKSLEEIKEEKSPLEIQINNFVRKMAMAGALVFLIVWLINFMNSNLVLDSLQKALTLAMSILPEEIPVAFTTFMALGAWTLMKKGIVVKQMKMVETLGSATVICTDKTGTITENKMTLAAIYPLKTGVINTLNTELNADEKELIRMAMWASEPIPFDPMEIALHEAYTKYNVPDERSKYKLEHEYPLEGKPPMMTHVFEDTAGNRIIAAKGAAEALIAVSELSADQHQHLDDTITRLANEGYRILGVGKTNFEGIDFPEHQQDFDFSFIGIVAFYDPPKSNIATVLTGFYNAGLSVKILTGDNAVTTKAIGRLIGLRGNDISIDGNEVMSMNDAMLEECVKNTNVFTRVFPEAKLKIINALKKTKAIVAMTGDGINDGPALKAAHIGIAMGNKGTVIAREAASLILLEDDLSKMIDAIALGRRIYSNLKKAIQYIISIHIPIILTVFIPLVLGWLYPNLLSPVHIIFLELIMGPTCSIIYENEPMEPNIMHQKPRPFHTTFLTRQEILTSVSQGLVITAATLFVYLYGVNGHYNEAGTRTLVFIVLISANICLTLENRSFYYSLFTTLRYKNNLVPFIISITLCLTAIIIYIPVCRHFFGFTLMPLRDIALAIITGCASVLWFEIVKVIKRISAN
jgi:Ca2+-transporting ATPase